MGDFGTHPGAVDVLGICPFRSIPSTPRTATPRLHVPPAPRPSPPRLARSDTVRLSEQVRSRGLVHAAALQNRLQLLTSGAAFRASRETREVSWRSARGRLEKPE